ncbi:MAG: transcriptional regulator [Dermatophilaceae bacterium]
MVTAASKRSLSAASKSAVRPLVWESWARARRRFASPECAAAQLVLDGEELSRLRQQHELVVIMPVIRRLLIEPCTGAGLVVAVGDALGRLLWVEGDRATRRRAEGMLFAPGADWSEDVVGTNAPGTALLLRGGVQIAGAEHFSPSVQRWSCTAVPLLDPATGTPFGVVDITGGSAAVAPHSLPLVYAAVAAALTELAVAQLRGSNPGGLSTPIATNPAVSAGSVGLHVLGRRGALLRVGSDQVELSLRHSEILTVLALHRDGLTAGELATQVNPNLTETTLRAELVRLRHLLTGVVFGLALGSRPYRFLTPPRVDALEVLRLLDKGAHRQALHAYHGSVLPVSESPGIIRLRDRVGHRLRDAVLADASIDVLLTYVSLPETEFDVEARLALLRRLPARSPKRAALVEQVEHIESVLR